MKNLVLFLLLIAAISQFAQSRMIIWKGGVKVDSAEVSNDLKITFKTVNFKCEVDTVVYGGQTYRSVKIGDQCWLKENLNIGLKINGN